MNGRLREHPLAELIREISAAKLSGALRLARERVQAVVYAEAGQIVFARSNLRVHRLAVCLHRWGALAEDKLSALVTEFMSDAEASASLIAAGALTKETLAKLLARQATDVLRPLLLWTEGEWSFDPRARLAEEVRCKLELSPMLLEAARQLPAEFVATRLDDDAEIISPVPELPAQLPLIALEGFVLSRVESPLALGELLAISGLPEAQVRQCVYALALGGFLARAAWPAALSSSHAPAGTPATVKPPAAGDAAAAAQPLSEAKDAPAATGAPDADATPNPRAEIDALFALVYEADHFRILKVGRSADGAEIKRAYYALAKRFHPDRFQRDATDYERTQIEAAFMKITQAYETLRDPRARAAYEIKIGAQAGASAASPDSSAKSTANSHLPRDQRAAQSFADGLAALKQNNLSAAVTLLGEAARLAPQQSRYHAFYGSALARDVRTRHQAEAELQTAIKLDSNDPAYRVMLAELLHVLGQRLRAERELERALSLDPHHDTARRLLNQLRKTKRSDSTSDG